MHTIAMIVGLTMFVIPALLLDRLKYNQLKPAFRFAVLGVAILILTNFL